MAHREFTQRWRLGSSAVTQLLRQNMGLVAKIAISNATGRRSKTGLIGGVSVHDLMHEGIQVM